VIGSHWDTNGLSKNRTPKDQKGVIDTELKKGFKSL
jgi:hypothetical protein